MSLSLDRGPALAWLVLVLATVASVLLGTDHGLHDPDAIAALVLAIAFAKVHIVGRHFMELGGVAPVLRRAVDVWVLVVGATLIVLALAL